MTWTDKLRVIAAEATGVAADAADKVRDAAGRAAPAVTQAAGKVVPAFKGAARAGASAARDVADTVVPAVRDVAAKAVPAAADAAVKAVPAVADVAGDVIEAAVGAALRSGKPASAAAAAAKCAAKGAAAKAARAAAGAATEAAVKNAAGMQDADSRPHAVHNERTNQDVVVEAYVKRPDGTRDYASVYPGGAKSDFGPVGNKAVGMLLIMAGVPMLVLPGPGVAAMAAGFYFLSKSSKDPGVQGGEGVSDGFPESSGV